MRYTVRKERENNAEDAAERHNGSMFCMWFRSMLVDTTMHPGDIAAAHSCVAILVEYDSASVLTHGNCACNTILYQYYTIMTWFGKLKTWGAYKNRDFVS